MAYKNYKIRDNWLDIDKYNDVDIQSVDGVISTVKVNGEDYGGGGGGSSANIPSVNIDEQNLRYTCDVSFNDWVALIENSSFLLTEDGSKQWPVYDPNSYRFFNSILDDTPTTTIIVDAYYELYADGTVEILE